MNSTARDRRVLGVLVELVAGALGGATEWAAHRDVADADRLSRSADSVTRASGQYHGANAVRTLTTRWHWTGHGTLGALGVLLGVALIALPGNSRRP